MFNEKDRSNCFVWSKLLNESCASPDTRQKTVPFAMLFCLSAMWIVDQIFTH